MKNSAGYCGVLILALWATSCLFEQSSREGVLPALPALPVLLVLPVLPEDQSIPGYRVRSYFNQPSGTEWKMVYGQGSLETEPLHFLNPPMSARIIGTTSPTTIIEKTLEPVENVCGDQVVSLKIWAPSQKNLESVEVFSISMIGGPELKDSANYPLHHRIRNPQLVDAGHWTRLNMSVSTFNTSPSFDCHRVSRVRIRLSARPGLQDTLYLGELAFYKSPLPTASLIITEDDQWADFDTNGTPAMRKYGFPGTIYANGGLLGVFNKIGLERLKTLQDSGGWTIGSHLWTHDSITALTNDSADLSLKRNAAFLRDNGLTGYRHFAYPYGRSDRAKDSVVRLNAETARLAVGWPDGEPLPYADPYRLRVLGFLEAKVTLEMGKGAIRNLVENRTAGILGVHQIVTAGPLDGNKWYREDWEALMDYIQGFVLEGRLKVYSLEEFLRVTADSSRVR